MATTPRPITAHAASTHPTMRVLLVTDRREPELQLHGQSAWLQHPPSVVHVARALAGALAWLQEHPQGCDCVVAANQLPDGAGAAVVEALVLQAPRVPVVALVPDAEQGVAALAAGAQDFVLDVTTQPDALERAVRHAVTRQDLANQLAESARDVENLVYSVGHDLRGPLAVATGFVAVLGDSALPEDARESLEAIERSLHRIERITEDVVRYTKSVHGQLEIVPVELRGLVLVVAAEAMLGDHVTVAPDLPVVAADVEALREVLCNVLDNAVRYADPDRPPEVTVTAQRHDLGWQVNVDDNGIGIEPAQRERVFDLFVHGSNGEHLDGSGIGLAISRRVVERHRGRIWAEPNPSGRGTRVAFVLPEPLVEADR